MLRKLIVAVAVGAAVALLPLEASTPAVRALTALTNLAAVAATPPQAATVSAARRRPRPTPTPAPPAPGACTLTVPDDPLSARGLATPWLLAGAGCHETDPNMAAFVQAAVIAPGSGQVSVYNPLVIDQGTKPAIAPVVPNLPDDAVVSVWVGFNGAALSLTGPGAQRCVDRVNGSIFGQNAYCNATAFFEAAHDAMNAGKLAPPPLGTAKDGKPCPTTRDFSIVDQDQSDNTTTQYLIATDGRVAQDTPQNLARLKGAKVQFNGSDERLVAIAMDHALGCTPWTAPDLADPTHAQRVPAQQLNELMAGVRQAAPIALVPALDPFALVNGNTSLAKLNAFRAGVDQPRVGSLSRASTKTYCTNLYHAGLPRIVADRAMTMAAASPFPNLANSLFTFLAMRYQFTFADAGGLTCNKLLNMQNPVTTTIDANGVVVDAKIALPAA
jgi:hypothetical protein